MQRVEIEFLAGINYNTLLLFYIQYMTIFYMKIPCKALHWPDLEFVGLHLKILGQLLERESRKLLTICTLHAGFRFVLFLSLFICYCMLFATEYCGIYKLGSNLSLDQNRRFYYWMFRC